ITTSVAVILDTTPPTMSIFNIVISRDVSRDVGEVPISDDYGIWYNKDVILGYITWSSTQQTDDSLVTGNIYIKGNKLSTYESIGFMDSSATFAIQVVPAQAIPVTLRAYIRDKAGNVLITTANVYVNTDAPGLGEVFIVPDLASDGWFNPRVGYYKQRNVSFYWTKPYGILRNKPYQTRSSLTENWTLPQSSTEYNNYFAMPGNQKIIIKAIDYAGNISTFSALVTVDISAPATASACISPDAGSHYNGFDPIDGYYDNNEVIVTWEEGTDTDLDFYMILTHNIKDLLPEAAGASLKIPSNVRVATVNITSQGINTLSVIAVDMAGNYSVKLLTVNLDTIPPTFSVKINEYFFTETSQNLLIITVSSGELIGRSTGALWITMNIFADGGANKSITKQSGTLKKNYKYKPLHNKSISKK
ncbi:MAG: hypothetical protein WCH76_08255, partial [Candidatus Riflemargulisbacteria bacterium]